MYDRASNEPTLWFSADEYRARLTRVQQEIRARGLDALLAFEPESITYLTGFTSIQYAQFQFLIVPADGEPTFVVRNVLRYRIERMCAVADRHWWTDGERSADIASRAIRSRLRPGSRVGIELGAWALNARLFGEMQEGLADIRFSDATGLVGSLRLIKSPAELEMIRRACAAAEGAMGTAVSMLGPGVSERALAAEVARALVLHGADSTKVDMVATGPSARHLGCSWTDRVMQDGDPVFLEIDAEVCRYRGRFIRSARIGSATDEELALAERLLRIQESAIASVAPGVPCSVPDTIYRDGIEDTGVIEKYPNKTFYSVGSMIGPTSFESLEATPGAAWAFAPGMVFHTYLSAGGMNFSEMVTVTETGVEQLTGFPRRLIVAPVTDLAGWAPPPTYA